VPRNEAALCQVIAGPTAEPHPLTGDPKLYRDTSRPFERPTTGRIAVKVINHFGDEVMKAFSV
jgi:hypothetical protein